VRKWFAGDGTLAGDARGRDSLRPIDTAGTLLGCAGAVHTARRNAGGRAGLFPPPRSARPVRAQCCSWYSRSLALGSSAGGNSAAAKGQRRCGWRVATSTARAARPRHSPAVWDCRFSPRRPLDTAPEKTGPTRGERVFEIFFEEFIPFTPSSRLALAAYRGAQLFIDTLVCGGGSLFLFISDRQPNNDTLCLTRRE
jgi:hypothetical protein